jgi:hypothetical protein
MRDKQRLAGIVAISAAAVMLLAVVILSIHRSHPATAPAGPAPTAETAAVEPAAPEVEPGKKVAAADGESKPSGRPAENADGGLPRSEPAAIAPLRRLFEEAKETAVPASGEASPIGNRPQPLGPPPTVNQGRESGVLQWAGSTPASGGQVVIFDGTQLGGALSGDALPGVPVSVSVENPDVRITEAPSPGNGNRRLVLQAPANLNRPIRINWQVQKGSRP